MIKISILIPIYNTEKYLKQCLDSVINQTLKDIEIICLNDGSTDSSPEIIDSYAEKDKRIKVIHKENTGYGHTMNIGMSIAKGEYIGIVESDDYVKKDMFEKLYAQTLSNNIDVVKSDYYFLYDEGIKQANIFKDINCNGVFTAKDIPQLFYMTPCIWSAIYKKEFLTNNCITFNETPGASYQDLSFSLMVWLNAKKIIIDSTPYLYYRYDNPNSSIYAENKMFCVIDEFNKIRNYISKHPLASQSDIQYVDKTAFVIFNSYINMVSSQHKFAFIVKCSDYYKKWANELPLNCDFLTSDESELLNLIIEQPEQALKQYLEIEDKRISFQGISSFSLNTELYAEAIMNYLSTSPSIIIYGAGLVGDIVYKILKKRNLDKKIIEFTTTAQNSSDNFHGYNINIFDKSFLSYPDTVYLISIADKHQYEVLKILKHKGVKNVISMNADLRRILTKKYLMDDYK